MSDETTVEAGSENSGDQEETSSEESTDTAAETTDASVETAQDAGDAAEQPKTGDPCTCPDGRAGTVHVLDEGLVCLPNQG